MRGRAALSLSLARLPEWLALGAAALDMTVLFDCCAAPAEEGPTRSARPRSFFSAELVRMLGLARLNFARLAQSVAHLTSIQLLNQSGGCGFEPRVGLLLPGTRNDGIRSSASVDLPEAAARLLFGPGTAFLT